MKHGLIAVFGVTLVASFVFMLNHGFGGGHGAYDSILGILALPWVLLPWPNFLFKYDFLWLVFTPFILNLLVVLVVGKLVLKLKSLSS